MTNATYTLHMMLLRLARGALTAWEKWLAATCSDPNGSIELPRPKDAELTSGGIPARQTVDRATQPSVSSDDRSRRSVVETR
jgi:hypothetical protein